MWLTRNYGGLRNVSIGPCVWIHDDGGLQIVALFRDMVQPSWRKDIIGGAVWEFIALPEFQYILWPEMGSRSFLFWLPATMIFLSLYTDCPSGTRILHVLFRLQVS